MLIEKHIPFPEQPKAKVSYPFREMEVGDSLFAEGDNGQRLVNAANGFRSRNAGWAYTSHREGGGVRIWRTA